MDSQIVKSKISEGTKFLNERFQYHFGLSEDESKKLLVALIDITVLQTTISLQDNVSVKDKPSSKLVSDESSPKLTFVSSKTGDLLNDISDIDWLQNCIKRLFFILEQLDNIIGAADPNTCSIYFDEILQKLSERNTLLESKGVDLYRK